MKRFILCIGVLVHSVISLAQDAHFTQYDKMPLFLNPALSGLNFKTQGNLIYRNQWTSVDAPFNSLGASFDQRIETRNRNSFFGLGLYVISDNSGNRTLSSLDLKLSGSGHIKLNDMSTIGLGIQAGLLQRTLNSGGFQWGSQYDGNDYNASIINLEGSDFYDFKVMDASAGIVYSYNSSDFLRVTGNNDNQFSVGLNASHLNRPKNSFISSSERLPIKYSLFVNSLIVLPNSNVAFGPTALIQMQGNAREVLIGTRVRYLLQQASKFTGFRSASAASIGFYYRHKDALMAMVQYEIANYSIGLTYDFNVSTLNPHTNLRGGFEISFRYAAPNPFGSSKARI
jgi:type IX secretion system PorP/SprF family membrane protein